MRLGGPLFGEISDAELWVAEVRRQGYRAAVCPPDLKPDDARTQEYRRAATRADIVIAEVGAWSNPLSCDQATRTEALTLCKARLALADQLGARCCVNVAGSRGVKMDDLDPRNLTEETFDLIVGTVREIIDAVQPSRTFYTLEAHPRIFPNSLPTYTRLIAAINRPQFAVHLDPTNLITSPQLYFNNAAFIRECFATLGPYIRSCHAKDVLLTDDFVVNLKEVRPGLGALDYPVYLRELAKIDPDTPLILEHLPSEEEYTRAADYVRGVAAEQRLD